MRHLLPFCLLFVWFGGFAQTGVKPLSPDSISANGYVWKDGWRWQAGDNPAWASPAFDDRRWETLRATRRIGRLRQVAGAGISWFRLPFAIDSALSREPLALDVAMNGAAELYLDGTRLATFGTVSTSAAGEVKYKRVRGTLHGLPPLAPGPHTLALRFSTHPQPWYVPDYIERKETLELTLCRAATYTRHQVGRTHINTLLDFLLVGSFLMLSAIHFLYYIYRRRIINLIFGLTTLFYCLNIVANNLPPYLPSLTAASWADYLGSIFSYSFPLMLAATYHLYLQRKPGRLFWIIAGVTLIALLLLYFPNNHENALVSELPRFVLALTVVVLLFDGLRITVMGLRQSQSREKAVTILISFTVLIVVLIVGIFIIALISWRLPSMREDAAATLGTLMTYGLAMTLAVLLAKEHDQTSSDLQKRLKEVEKLSGEKETILTQQNELLEQRVARRTEKLNRSLQELRDAQTQLVQREKMASLGELTAGIAHEIQNPLNFVNNFSEVSAELLDELKQEQARPAAERDEGLEAELLADIHQNVGKIGHHGQRAASIVRGMLQHSRASTGERQPTDLNALGDEYIRLSYHGLRAKDKTDSASRFNANLHTSLDPALEPVNVVAQDMGRVLLNLFNNAFYAVWEKAKAASQTGDSYHPTVWLYTRQLDGHVEIKVQDNGNGIPEALQRKIFQPFFTTKPTGQGTGLGLSLSYDIITKGHAGTLSVDTKPGEYTAFIITLPTK